MAGRMALPFPLRRLGALILPLALALALGATTAAQASAAGCANATAAVARAPEASVSKAVRCLVNAQRAEHHLSPLRPARARRGAADRHSREMVLRRFFAHVAPGGSTLTDRARRAGYS